MVGPRSHCICAVADGDKPGAGTDADDLVAGVMNRKWAMPAQLTEVIHLRIEAGQEQQVTGRLPSVQCLIRPPIDRELDGSAYLDGVVHRYPVLLPPRLGGPFV